MYAFNFMFPSSLFFCFLMGEWAAAKENGSAPSARMVLRASGRYVCAGLGRVLVFVEVGGEVFFRKADGWMDCMCSADVG